MINLTKAHFVRAALEIGQSGENDTLPYDLDAAFIKARADHLAQIAFDLFSLIEGKSRDDAKAFVSGLIIGAERLLVPSGSHGFRLTTKIHPFWNLYLNGLGLAIAEANEPNRSDRAHSYRLGNEPPAFFDKARSWRAYKEATLQEAGLNEPNCVVVQTDIASFYEHIYHHRLESALNGLSPNSNLAAQMDRILSKLASGRSFGLPVGGQCARVLAEVMMTAIDRSLSDAGICWHRYVDDYTLVCTSQQDAYTALSTLSQTLADYGLSLNRSKTTILSAAHYVEFINAQLGGGDDATIALSEIDLHFDPYSDNPEADYEELRRSIEDIDMQFLLELEKEKSQPDNFVVAQIGRALKFQEPKVAIQLCATLLDPRNLDNFRASWSKIMRGVYSVRVSEDFVDVFDGIDNMLDMLPAVVPHLLYPEANLLHYLRAIRFKRSDVRGTFVRTTYERTSSQWVKRACIDCWRAWSDGASYTRLRNNWQNLGPDEQRMFWLSLDSFGEDGKFAKVQLRKTLGQAWRLGFEADSAQTFAACFEEWVKNEAP